MIGYRTKGSTDVTEYFVLRDSTTKSPKTNCTITDVDLYYLEERSAMATKVDCSALAAANSAHADNSGYNVGLGLYRIDWPDAAFDGAVGKRAYLIAVHASCDTEVKEIILTSATRGLSGTALPDAAADAAGGLPISDAGGLDLDAQIKTDIDGIKAKTDSLKFTVANNVDCNVQYVNDTICPAGDPFV